MNRGTNNNNNNNDNNNNSNKYINNNNNNKNRINNNKKIIYLKFNIHNTHKLLYVYNTSSDTISHIKNIELTILKYHKIKVVKKLVGNV